MSVLFYIRFAFVKHLITFGSYYLLSSLYNRQTKSFIIKVDLADQTTKNELDAFNIFKREITFYDEILPEIQKIIETEKLCAACYKTNANPRYLIFEDLRSLGYSNYNRILGLPSKHATLAVEKLALFHAASAIISQNNPGVFKNQNIVALDPNNTFFLPLFQNAILGCAGVLPEFREKLEHFSKFAVAKGRKAFDLIENSFFVLNHGDLWMNNLMFRCNERMEVVDVLMVGIL